MIKLDFCDLSGKVITQYDIEYEKLRQEWNRANQRYPIAIVYCFNYRDVSNAILWARKRGVPIRIRSGGHNYLGYSTGNSVLVIDISNLKNIKLNEKIYYVKVEAGVKNKQLYDALTSKGYPFPGGTCPTVGVSGFTLGGGWGLSCRKFGLGCDSLLEIELINFEGKLIKANQFINSDLFWAVRGSGGGNYGVIVSMTFTLQSKKVDKVSLFSIYYPNASRETQHEFFDTWQNWIMNASKDINMRAGIYNDSTEGMYVYSIGLSYKDEYRTEKSLKPFLEIPGSQLSIQYIPLKKAIELIEQSYPPYEYFKSAGRFVYKCYKPSEIEDIIEIVNRKRPAGSDLISVNMYGLGGNVSKVDKYDTAFYYRDARYILYIQTVFENNEYLRDNFKWVNYYYPFLSRITYGSYVNFPYVPLPRYECEYYGENASRINKVKRKYDPYNVFSFPQSVGYYK